MFNKEFFIAFLLIFSTFLFFNSDFYNYTLLKKEKIAPQHQNHEPNSPSDAIKESKYQQKAINEISNQDAALQEAVTEVIGRTITVIGKKYTATFSTKGALATSWILNEYTGLDQAAHNLISDSNKAIFNFSAGAVDFDQMLFEVTAPDTIVLNKKQELTFFIKDNFGLLAEKKFTLHPDSFEIGADLFFRSGKNDKYSFGWKGGIKESEKDPDTKLADPAINIYYGEDVDHPVDNNDSVKIIDGLIKWTSLRSKYFSGTFVPDKAADFTVTARKLPQTEHSGNPHNFSFMMEGRLENGRASYKVLLIPNKHAILKSYDIKLDKILFKGYSWFFKADIWFPKLCGLLVTLLNWFYEKIPNYGVAILLLTLLMKIVTLPLTLKSSKSMARMKLLAPKLKAIQEKHKGDPMGQQQAMMKMYKEEGVSPLGGAGGCLPMILQMPIFIALFVALRKAIELRGAPFAFWVQDLSAPEIMVNLPFSIPFFGAHLSLLNIIMAISMFFQSKQSMTGSDPNQKMMVYFMPIMMFVMFNNMPAGLLLYWSLSNILGIVQNAFIKVNPEELKKKPKKKSIFGKKPSYNEILKRMGKK